MGPLDIQHLGILGGGQLGRMSILAGRRLGYRFHVYEPKPGGCAGPVADSELNAPWDDTDALGQWAQRIELATLEFENVPRAACDTVGRHVPLRPSATILEIAQHRAKEKTWLSQHGYPVVPFAVVDRSNLATEIESIGWPAVVKTAAFGYDGKGQVKVPEGPVDAAALWQRLGSPESMVVERWLEHQGEFSVLVARNGQGQIATFPVAENIHRHHILHMSLLPARLSAQKAAEASAMAAQLARDLALEGLLAVELFLVDDRWIINELAPRPHNSGHATLEAALTSQFEQHIRAVVGLPLGDPALLRPAVMVNLLGDLWAAGEPRWEQLLADPRLKLHLYDKGAPAIGRKMGHFTVLDSDLEVARLLAERHYQLLAQALE